MNSESKYRERFKRLIDNVRGEEGEEYGTLMCLKGDMMLVEKLAKIERKTKSGIIIADHKSYKGNFGDDEAEFAIVLMVGPGQILEDGSILRPDCKPGDVILLPGNVEWYSQFGHMADYEPYTIGRLRDSQVGMVFPDYIKCMALLNGETV